MNRKIRMKITAMRCEYCNTINATSRMFIGGKNPRVIGGWVFKQTSCSFLRTSGFRKAMFARRFILLSSLHRLVLSLSDNHLYCYVIYLSHPRREGMRALRGISGTGGVALLFTLANFAPREATRPGLQDDAQFRTFPFDKRASLSETLAPRESLRSREGKRRRSGNERATRGRVSILADGRD